MKKQIKISLKVKILGLVISLLLIVLSLITFMVGYMESKEDVKNAEELALQTAKTLSYMPVIQETFKTNNPTSNLHQTTEQIRDEANASAIKIINRAGDLYSKASVTSDVTAVKGEEYKATIFGSHYILHTGENDNEILKAIAPITIDYGGYKKIEGAIIVEFKMTTIQKEIMSDIQKIVMTSGVVFLFGIAGSFLLARSIRKDTLGLEPFEISGLYLERNAVLQSVKEGIIAVDHKGMVTMINHSARQLLGIPENTIGQKMSNVTSSAQLLGMVKSKKALVDEELHYKDKIVIVNTCPVIEDGQAIGTVASFRDKTEIKQMLDALSEVRQYSEDLRAQAHEFTSKLYVILGLIQLGKHQEAIELIQEEAQSQEQVTEMFFKDIHDEKIQAILLGKFAKASEKKITFTIEEGSSLNPLPEHIRLSPLIVILGNLINNAFEAVSNVNDQRVSFFVTDLGKDIIFEIADHGPGLQKGVEEQMFQKGFSLKGSNRGYGLANVKEEVDQLNGSIEITSYEGEGTIFTIVLPKQIDVLTAVD